MATIPSGTRFIGISQQADLTERKSGISNSVTEPFTIEEILTPSQSAISGDGTNIGTDSVLSYNVNLVSASAGDYSVRLPEPSLGGVVGVVNTSAVSVYVFPYDLASSILGLPAGEPFVVPADGQLYNFTCVQNPAVGVWSVAIPASNNSITKSVSTLLTADGTHVSGTESYSAAALLNASSTTYTLSSGPIYVLNAPGTGVDYFATPEFNTYNSVRISSFIVKSNVRAGDLSNNPAQLTSTLMGLTSAQLSNMFGYVRKAYIDGASVFTENIYNSFRYIDTYSLEVYSGISTGVIGHYMKPDGLLYQQIEVKSPNNPWQATKDSNGNIAIYFSPYLGYGGGATPYSGYPGGFAFEGEVTVEFEFKM